MRRGASIPPKSQDPTKAWEVMRGVFAPMGEMIAAQKETVGLNTGAQGIGKSAVVDDDRTRKPTLADAGISKDLSSRAQKQDVRGCITTGCRASHGVKPAPFLDEINPTSLDITFHPLPGGGQ